MRYHRQAVLCANAARRAPTTVRCWPCDDYNICRYDADNVQFVDQ